MIKILSFIALAALSVSLVSANCDYHVNSLSDLNDFFANDQTGWPSVPTLCFAAGTYSLTENLLITTSQNWVGPQQGVDPTCGRLINPPCARYTSSSALNATVEAVFILGGFGVHSQSVSNLNFSMDGFAVNGQYSNLINQNTGMGFSVTLKNIYSYQMFASAYSLSFENCYIGWSSSGSFVVSSTVFTTIQNSFFNQVGAFSSTSGSLTAIGNTFTFTDAAAYLSAPGHFENNAFYAIKFNVIYDYFGQASFKNNTFWATTTGGVYAPTVQSILDFESNCFVDSYAGYDVLAFMHDFNTTTAVFTNNYFGNPNGPQIVFDHPTYTMLGSKFAPKIEVLDQTDFDFKYSAKRLHFQAPNVCPHPAFSLSVKPSNIKLGETVNITFSFELDPLIVAAGITPNMFDGITLILQLYGADLSASSSNNLNAFGSSSQLTWNPSTQSSFSVLYTFQANDLLYNANGIASPPNYYVYASLAQYSSSALNNVFISRAYAPITITPKVPLECYNMSLSINKNVTGPLKYSFQQLGCSSSNWKIISVNTSNLFSFDSNQNLTINTGRNTSGVRLARYQVSFFSKSISGPLDLVHNVVTKINIVNHNPVINSANFTWIYPRTQQTFPNWNLLANCTDQDGDNVTVVQIQRNRARTNTSVVQLDAFTLHFVPEKVVVSVLPTGEISLAAPSNSNPVTAGPPISLFWKESLSFQFQITDGDVNKQYAWGIADITYFLSSTK